MLTRLLAPALLLAGMQFAAPSLAVAADNTASVLARMDREASTFRDMTANVKNSTYTAVISDLTEETGKVWMKRTSRGIALRTDITGKDQRSIGVQGGKAEIYYPKINTVQIYDLGKNAELVQQFLMVGWGSSRKDLESNYSVKASGEETVAGQKATRVDLVPKSAKALQQVKMVQLWIPQNAGHPVQQKVLQPGGDYYLVTYSDIRLNSNLPDSDVNLKLPANVKREYPQK